jgi:hypothetical protein
MPQGYYTIEQWKRPKKGAAFEWVAILHLPFGASLTDAERAVQERAMPGLFRVVQMQRVIWAEPEDGKLRLRKSHASSPRGLDGIREMFERSGGKYPVEEVRAARRQSKGRGK